MPPLMQSRLGVMRLGYSRLGYPAADPPTFTVSPLSLTFSPQIFGTTFLSQRVTITNTGPVTITLAGAALSGVHAAQFSTATTCGSTLAPAASCWWDVTFTSASSGINTAALTLSVVYPATTITIPLLGSTYASVFPLPFAIHIGGVDRTGLCRVTGLSVQQTLDGVPDTATLRCAGFVPATGQEVKVYLIGLTSADLEFAGHIQERSAIHEGPATNIAFDLTCIDYTWLMTRRKVVGQWLSQSASAIAAAILPTGFTGTNIVAGLPTVDELTLSDVDSPDAYDQLMQRVGGSWYADYSKDIHAFLTDPTAADSITDANVNGMITIRETVDLSQVRTRILVTAGGSSASVALPASSVTLPVQDGTPFAASGQVTTPTQRLTYTGIANVAKLGTVSVGLPGTPPGAPTAALSNNHDGAMAVGYYRYRVTFVSASGETAGTTSPGVGAITTFGVSAAVPLGSPVAGTPGALRAGNYDYGITFENANGETTFAGSLSVLTVAVVTVPSSGPTLAAATITGGLLTAGTYKYVATYVDAGGETSAGTETQVTLSGGGPNAVSLTAIPTSSDARVTARRIYRSKVGQITRQFLTELSDNTTTIFTDLVADVSLGAPVPTANTSGTGQMALTSIDAGPTGTTARHVYRSAVGQAGAIRRVLTVPDNTTSTATDNTSDEGRGDLTPTVSAADGGQMALTSIATGPAGTTARNVYRSIVGSVGSAPTRFQRLATIPDNTTTVYTDNTPDASLGEDLGTGSLLAQIGDTSLQVTSLTPFATSGWVRVGSQILSHSGTSGGALVGIPATGLGSITSPIPVGSDVTAEPHLTGLVTTLPIALGESVRTFVVRDDAAAQAAMAVLIPAVADGIWEDAIDAGDVSAVEAAEIGDAHLALVKDPMRTLHFTTRNRSVKVGRNQVVSLTQPPIAGTYKIQRITITEYGQPNEHYPLRTCEASSRRFSLESLLRQFKRAN